MSTPHFGQVPLVLEKTVLMKVQLVHELMDMPYAASHQLQDGK